MVIITINKRLLSAVMFIILLGTLGFSIYSYIHGNESHISTLSQVNNSRLTSFMVSRNDSVSGYKNIEIFDMNKGEVIKRVKPNTLIRKEVKNHLNEIYGMYVKVKAFPDKGYIIRVPLEPPVDVKNKWLNDYNINSVEEVFIIFPEEGKPYLLVLDDKKRPLFYIFESHTDNLLKNLDFDLRND